MSNDLAPMQHFTERLKDSLRDDIARMVPDDVLKQMIQTVIREEFFTGKEVKDNYGRSTGIEPPKFHAMIIEAMKPRLNVEAAKIAERFAPQFEARLNEIVEQGAVSFVIGRLDVVFEEALRSLSQRWDFQQAVINALKSQGILKT